LIRIRAKFTLRWAGSEFFQEWDFFAAEGALKTAVQLEPNYAPAHHLYSGVLELGGRIHESIAEEEQAIRLDPLSLVSRCSLAEQLSLAGQYDRAVEQIQSMFAIDPHYPKAHESLGNRLPEKGALQQSHSRIRSGPCVMAAPSQWASWDTLTPVQARRRRR
jgi:tetratricopeptide (TPR) repeat protein